MALYTDKQRKAVVARACQAVQARVAGEKKVTLGTGKTKQVFDLNAGGWCGRFVRQVFETALGLRAFDWHFGAAKAVQTLRKLKPYRISLADRQPGDILGCPGDPGHIAIYIGGAFDPKKELVAENTISTRRGYPKAAGTKVSSWKDFVDQHSAVTVYRLFEVKR